MVYGTQITIVFMGFINQQTSLGGPTLHDICRISLYMFFSGVAILQPCCADVDSMGCCLVSMVFQTPLFQGFPPSSTRLPGSLERQCRVNKLDGHLLLAGVQHLWFSTVEVGWSSPYLFQVRKAPTRLVQDGAPSYVCWFVTPSKYSSKYHTLFFL